MSEKRLSQHLQALVAIPSVTGDLDASQQCITYAAEALTASGLHVETFASDGYPSLVATSRATKRPKLLLQAHLDVVPADPQQFTLTQKDKKYFGRGVFDMKFAAACFLTLAEELGKASELDYGIMLTTDEEIGGDNGVGYLLENGYAAEACLLPDGADNWHIESSAKGAWLVKATTRGQTAHGSQPWAGHSAIGNLLAFLHKVQQLVPQQASHTATTLLISMLQAGHAMNQVPDVAVATLDIRFFDTAAYKELSGSLQTLAKAYEVELSTEMYAPPVEHDVTHDAFRAWEAVVNEVRGQANGDYALSFGSSDARYFVDRGIPTIVTRPQGGGAHGNDEWLSRRGLIEFYECVKAYVTTFAKAAPVDSKTTKRYTTKQLPETVAADT